MKKIGSVTGRDVRHLCPGWRISRAGVVPVFPEGFQGLLWGLSAQAAAAFCGMPFFTYIYGVIKKP